MNSNDLHEVRVTLSFKVNDNTEDYGDQDSLGWLLGRLGGLGGYDLEMEEE